VTCAHRSGRLPCLEWRRILELLERLDLPTWDPLVAATPEGVTCGMLERIGAGVRAEPVDPAAVLAAADALRERPRTPQARART
jgi:hypothetical protein